MEKDYRLEVRVRNNVFLKTMEKNGYNSLAQISRETGIPPVTLSKIVCLKETVFSKKGEMRPVYRKLCEFFNCSIYELAPEKHFDEVLGVNKVVREIDYAEVSNFLLENPRTPEQLIESRQLTKAIDDTMLGCLTPREERVVRLHFGLGGVEPHTLRDIAEHMGITPERVRQMERKAIRKMKHPMRTEKIREAMYE